METETAVSVTTGNGSQLLSNGLCCCCFELQSLKNLWSEYEWMGQSEVYGQMLMECFNLNLQQNTVSNNQICEVCITHLRNAVQFKQRVLESQVKLQEKLTSGEKDIEVIIVKEESGDLEDNDTGADSTVPIDFEQQSDVLADSVDTCPGNVKAKRKRPPKENKKIVKRMEKKIMKPKNDEDNNKCKKIVFHNTSYIKPRQNAALLLEHSTIVPFKCTKGYFMCLYCSKQHVGFDELRTHTIQSHDNLTIHMIMKSIYRPHDRIRADCSDITCKMCKNTLDNLEDLVSHLTESHNVKFFEEQKPTESILPYEMCDGKFKCYVCKTEFLFFKTLNNHMNTHSKEHICDICGRCFLLPQRLRAHIQFHTDEQAKCNICDKMCTSYYALQSHIRSKHKKLSYMCVICNLTFTTYNLRLTHMEEVHKRAPLNLTCKICSKQYTRPNSLNYHMRVEHLKVVREKERKHGCTVCGQMFKTPNSLASHALVHSGEKKFECNFCHKKYPRAKALNEHLKIHRNDRRWKCGLCSQAFVQKCSLKSHIRVHHPAMDYEALIVYKKPEKEE